MDTIFFLKSELLAALSDKEVLSSSAVMTSSHAKREPGKQRRLKELELEMRRFTIKERKRNVFFV